MMAIPNLADWFAPMTASTNEAAAEPEAQTEFAALLAASYIAPPASAAPTVPLTTSAEIIAPKSQAVPAVTEFFPPANWPTPMAAQPIMTGGKATEEPLKLFSPTSAEPILSPSVPLPETTFAPNLAAQEFNEPPHLTAQEFNEPPLVFSAAQPNAVNSEAPPEQNLAAAARLEKVVAPTLNAQPLSVVGQTPNQHYESSVRTTVEQVANQPDDVSAAPRIVTQPEQILRSDVRVAAPEVLRADTSSHSVIAPHRVAQTREAVVAPSRAANPPAAVNNVPPAPLPQATVPQHPDGLKFVLTESTHLARPYGQRTEERVVRGSVRTESPHQVVAAQTESAAERPSRVLTTVPQRNSDAMRLAAETVKTLVIENRAEPLSSPAVPTSESKAMVHAAPLVFEARATISTHVSDPMNGVETLPIETTSRPEAAPLSQVVPQAEALPKPIRARAFPTRMVAPENARSTMAVEPIAVPTVSDQLPEAVARQLPKELAQAGPASEPLQAGPTPVPKIAVASNAAPNEFTPLALPQEMPAAASATAFKADDASAETRTTLPTTTSPAAQPLLSSQPLGEAPPLVKQTIPPVVELAQRLDAPATRSLRLQLNPVELGRVDVEITRDAEGHVSAVLKVEQTETAQTLTHSLGHLRESLERAGLVVERLDVTLSPPLPAQTAPHSGQQFGQQPQQQPASPNHFTNADSLPDDLSGADGTASTADHKLLSMLA
jgi:flagellar hook-length control protein FliK